VAACWLLLFTLLTITHQTKFQEPKLPAVVAAVLVFLNYRPADLFIVVVLVVLVAIVCFLSSDFFAGAKFERLRNF